METPLLEDGGIKLFTDDKNAAALKQAVGADKSLVAFLRAHLSRLHAGGLFQSRAARIYRNERRARSASCNQSDTKCGNKKTSCHVSPGSALEVSAFDRAGV